MGEKTGFLWNVEVEKWKFWDCKGGKRCQGHLQPLVPAGGKILRRKRWKLGKTERKNGILREKRLKNGGNALKEKCGFWGKC